jgi:glycosyltransferase involved in cell wall biosynthesis
VPAANLELSVVIPIHNEVENVAALVAEFCEVLDAWGRPYELLLIDDGSTDGSFASLVVLQKTTPQLRVIQFRRNFGQTAAFAAGFAFARGRLVVTADGDLQNDPRDIPAMVARLDGGDGTGTYDLVCGWREKRQDPFLHRRLPSILANRLISWATGVRLRDYGCSLKVFRSEVVKELRLYGEMHRFLPALASEMGVRIAEQAVNHRARVHGRSKYGISRTLRVVLDLMTVKFLLSYSTRPLQMFGPIGMLAGGLGAFILAYLSFAKFVWHEGIGERPLLLFGILLVVTGVQLVSFGLLAELQSRTYHESQGKPIYVIRQIIGETDS